MTTIEEKGIKLLLRMPTSLNGRVARLPIEVCLTSEEQVELAGNPVIDEAFLCLTRDPSINYGFSAMVLSIPGGPLIVDPERPYQVTIDVLEDQEDDDPAPGEYTLDVHETFFLRSANGEISRGEIGIKVRMVLDESGWRFQLASAKYCEDLKEPGSI